MSHLKVLREVNNYTQEYVASKIGVDQSTYSKIERNPKNLRAEHVEKLAELYDVGVADILSSEGLTIHFSGHIEKNNGYVHNNYEMQREVLDKIYAAKDGEILSLKEQVEYLKKQNDQLLKMLEQK